MSSTDEDGFKLKVGPPMNRAKPKSTSSLNRLLKGRSISHLKRGGNKKSRPGARSGRGHTIAQFAGRNLGATGRRVAIKSHISKLKTAGGMSTRRHLRYIEREGVSREGEPGILYSSTGDTVDPVAFEKRGAGDRHQFRFIISPEDAVEIEDLTAFTRNLMSQMERDLDTKLDWVAVNHWDTDNPHIHLVLRGKDDRGRDLVISGDYMAYGMRGRAEELATQWLGPRSEREIAESLDRNVARERWTALDRHLQARAPEGVVNLEEVPTGFKEKADRARLIGRLQQLATMGLAEKIRPSVWRLDTDIERTLRELGERGDIVRTLHRAMQGAERDYIVPNEGGSTAVTGRVAAKGLADELRDVGYLVVDGIDGRAHYVRLSVHANLADYPIGAIVEVKGNVPRTTDSNIARLAEEGIYDPKRHLDLAAAQERNPASFVEAHVRRLEALRQARIVERLTDGRWRVPSDIEALGQSYDRSRAAGPVVEVRSHLSLAEQIRTVGATWLDRELLKPSTMSVVGFGADVREALTAREEFLVEESFARRQGQRILVIRDLLATLQSRELSKAAVGIESESGLVYREAVDGSRVSGIYRRSVLITSGRFAVLEDSGSFTLVPWRPVIEQNLGRSITATVDGLRVSWELGRTQGLSR